MFQVLARSTGRPLRTLPPAVVEKTTGQMTTDVPQVADRHFTALRRILDTQEPEYRH